MREIKFRAWEKDLKEMVYEGELCGYVEYDTNPVKAINLMLNGECEDYVFTQYTGLKDKNGREIYEGDIWTTWDEGRFVVEFEKERAGYYPFADGDGCGCCSSDIYDGESGKVIGNIYENPELLVEST